MASTGNVFPTVGANVDRAGNTAWANPGNVVSDNATDTTVAVPSDYLVTSGYGFTIPSDATILGVTVRVEASETGAGNSNFVPQLHSNTTPTLIGSAKSATTVNNTAKVVYTVGSTSDLWGATLTPAIVNGTEFGVSIWSDDTTNTLEVDYVTIAIEYATNTSITPTVASLTASGVAPSLLRGDILTPTVGNITATGFAPTVQEGIMPVLITPTVVPLELLGQAPRMDFGIGVQSAVRGN